MPISPELLEILACPACRSTLLERGDALLCTNAECRRKYAVRDDIPVMLVDEAETLDEPTWKTQTIDD